MQLICRLVRKEKLMRCILEKEIPLKVLTILLRNKEQRQSIQNIEVKELQNMIRAVENISLKLERHIQTNKKV